MIGGSGVDFSPLQQLCVDNADVRARIKANKQLEINIVPCILGLYPNGVVEKYEADHAFSWSEEIIKRFSPSPTPSVPAPSVSTPSVSAPSAPIPSQRAPTPDVNKTAPRPRRVPLPDEEEEAPRPRRMVPITSIEDIPFEEDGDNEEENDRHKLPIPPKRIRTNENTFIEDDELFQGETVDDRKASTKSIKSKGKNKEESSIMARAKEMAQHRDVDDNETNPASKRPMHARVP
jgi:hypothetical protein